VVATTCCVVWVRVTVETGAGFGAGLGTVTFVVRTVRTVCVLVVVGVAAGVADASGVTVALGSGVTGVASVTGGGFAVVTGAGSVGGTAWAHNGVEESASAAAIAGRAPASLNWVVLVIIQNNRGRGRRWHGYRPAEPQGR
jgi:hypothetical protein